LLTLLSLPLKKLKEKGGADSTNQTGPYAFAGPGLQRSGEDKAGR